MVAPFSVDLAHVDGQTIVRFVGELDMSVVERADLQARHALANDHSGPLIIDVGELTFCDSSGIRMLLSLEAAAGQHGRDVLLRRPGRALRLIIETLGLDSHFQVEPSQYAQESGTTSAHSPG